MSLLRVFNPVPVARDVHRDDSLPLTAREYGRDTITLGWEERVKTRGLRRSDAGLEFATTLVRGTVLGDGDCLVVDALRTVVVVVARKEPVFVVRPASLAEWGLFAYHIGNSHQPVMIDSDAILCPDVPGMEQLLTYHGIPFSRASRAFTPVAAGTNHRHRLELGIEN